MPKYMLTRAEKQVKYKSKFKATDELERYDDHQYEQTTSNSLEA